MNSPRPHEIEYLHPTRYNGPSRNSWGLTRIRAHRERATPGLEAVTPSLSSWPRRSRAFAAAYSFSVLCRSFTPLAVGAFVLVCTLSRGLVVARGSTASGSRAYRGSRPASHFVVQTERIVGYLHHYWNGVGFALAFLLLLRAGPGLPCRSWAS